MTLSEMRTRVRFLVAANLSQSDDDLSDDFLNSEINLAYVREWVDAWQSGDKNYFLDYEDFTWAASAATKTIPATVQARAVYKFFDITDGAANAVRLNVKFEDYETLRWGENGPSRTTTVRAVYIAKPETLSGNSDEPDFIPTEYHELLCYSAACELLGILDQSVPATFQERLETWRMRFAKYMSSRPIGDGARIVKNDQSAWMYP